MRSLLLATTFLLASLGLLSAQDQEGKLVDRLLRPNTNLQSSEQNRIFVADRVGATKRAQVKTLYLQEKSKPATFFGLRDFFARPHQTWTYNAASKSNARISHARMVSTSSYSTSLARTPVHLRDADKSVAGGGYAGNRAFRGQGKSQKSLDQKKPEMTIEQVRELLNKNK